MTSVVHDRFDVAADDGARLNVHRWRPSNARIAVVTLHGATSHGGWFATLADAFAARGIATYAPDRRGSGAVRALGLPETPAIWVDDLHRTLTAIASEPGIDEVVVAPWCFAAKLAVPALAAGAPATRMVFLAPAFAFSPAVSAGFAQALARADEFAVPAPDDAFVSAPHSLEFLATDPLRWRTMTRKFTELSRALLAETREVMPRIAAPMTAVFASGDRIADNQLGAEFAAQHGVTSRVIDGSHGFFMDDPARAAELLEPLVRGN
ncbi:MAG: alpha/beta fold hydrolase [Kofleriaceae bacterium]